MSMEIEKSAKVHVSPFERIKRTNDAGMEFWSSRDFAEVLTYGDYRNFEGVIEKAKLSCFNSGHRIEDHFVDVTEMIEIGKGASARSKPFSCRATPATWLFRTPTPRKRLWRMVKPISPSRPDGRNWRMEASRRSDEFSCVKRCATIMRSWPTRPGMRGLSNP